MRGKTGNVGGKPCYPATRHVIAFRCAIAGTQSIPERCNYMTQNVRIKGPRRLAGRRRSAAVAAGLLGAAALAGALAQPAVAASGPSAAKGAAGPVTGNPHAMGELPSPPRPPSGLPRQPAGYQA